MPFLTERLIAPLTLVADVSSEHANTAMITNDAVIFGILMSLLALIFWSANSQFQILKSFYKIFPMLLLCYFLPSLLTFFGVVDPNKTQLYSMASRFLLPASLVLLTISIDLKEIIGLGPKALIMFLVGSLGVVLGGPIAILVVGFFDPQLVGGSGPDAVWRGLSTVAGSWIGGGANQVALKEIFLPSNDLFSVMIAVDVIVAEIWMLFLLLGVANADAIDRFFKADTSAVERLKLKMDQFSQNSARIPKTHELFAIGGVAFGSTAACHWAADWLAPWFTVNYPNLKQFSLHSDFFWMIVLVTIVGIAMSFTRLKNLEGAGASKIGTVFIYILVATIGLKMDIRALAEHPGLFVVGGVWMSFHVGLMVLAAWLIRAPYFFLAVGSKANIGGAASAPVVAAAFHPSLAPVGVLLAVLGYALGTYGGWLSALMMQAVSPT